MTPEGSGPNLSVLVGGHESDNGADLSFITSHLPDILISPPGRPLNNIVTRALNATDGVVTVLPMTFGRNPTMVADVAKTLQWLDSRTNAGRLALADPFGSPDHLVAWLRNAATRTHATRPGAALVIMARSSNPFDDAELYRLAHLVRTHGAGNEVEVSCVEVDEQVLDAVQRLRMLGFTESEIVPAGFARHLAVDLDAPDAAGAEFYGPLMSEQAIVRVVTDRIQAAVHALSHGRNGISDGLLADHGHGYAHSHAFEESQGSHTHTHGGAPHSHGGARQQQESSPHEHDPHDRVRADAPTHTSPPVLTQNH